MVSTFLVGVRRSLLVVLAVAAVAAAVLLGSGSARAHGFNSIVYVQLSSPAQHEVTAELSVEYDLLIYSVDKNEKTLDPDSWNDDFYHQAHELAFENPHGVPQSQSNAAMAEAITDFAAPVQRYLADRFTIAVGDQMCTATLEPTATVRFRDPGTGKVPYADVTLDYTCPGGTDDAPVVTSTLFPDSEGFVAGTKTLVSYDLSGFNERGGSTGELILDQGTTSASVHQTRVKQFWEFFSTGFLHVLHGLDHILFLVALIAGSRRLREVILCATAFTAAHAVTVSLVALGAFTPPSNIVEPTIAFSIAAVAAWHLVRLVVHKGHTDEIDSAGAGHFSLDRDGWIRVGIVFAFGLVHGMGFARALDLNGRSGWNQLLSLLSFNVGIEAVQLCLIVVLFPLLVLLRRRSHLVWLWATGAVAAGVAVMGLIWFVGRVSGWYDISSDIG